MSRPVVAKPIEKVGSIELTYREVATLSDTELAEIFSGKPKPNGKVDALKAKFPYYAKELKRTGVTLQHH